MYPHFMELEPEAQREVPCPRWHSEVATVGSCKFLFYGHLPIQCLKFFEGVSCDGHYIM